MSSLKVKGVLLLYNHPLTKNAPTIMDHVESFGQYSRFKVWKVNTEGGFPRRLKELKFEVILLHYSLFGLKHLLSETFLYYLKSSRDSYKVAFFQDEYRFCKKRFDFINYYKLDCVFTLIEASYFEHTYLKHTKIPRLVYCLPGYVSEAMLAASHKYSKLDGNRTTDIGYRGRKLEYYMGRGALEKYEIAIKFQQRASGLGLSLDIEANESKRIYGEKWYQFIGNCRFVLGVESGVSIFDVDDVIYEGYQRVMASNPRISFEEMSKELNFCDWEDRIYYRTISPRHFEAAAFQVCQILFEGKYSGIMSPMTHYIPLKKDFSNFDSVMKMFKDPMLRNELTENAYNDLIASELYTYKKFVSNVFDRVLLEAGLSPEMDVKEVERVTEILNEDARLRQVRGAIKITWYFQFPGRSLLAPLVKPVLQKLGQIKERKA